MLMIQIPMLVVTVRLTKTRWAMMRSGIAKRWDRNLIEVCALIAMLIVMVLVSDVIDWFQICLLFWLFACLFVCLFGISRFFFILISRNR
jgi:hypothetical protein